MMQDNSIASQKLPGESQDEGVKKGEGEMPYAPWNKRACTTRLRASSLQPVRRLPPLSLFCPFSLFSVPLAECSQG